MESSDGDRPSSAEPLGALVVEVLERLEFEGSQALEEACRAHPGLAEALRRRVAALADAGLVRLDRPSGSPPGAGRFDVSGRSERMGDFELLEKIGAGGMGVVYRAEQLSLGREVALKLIRPESLHLQDARERFTRETAIVAKLAHPGIIPIHVVGDDEELPYYAMELVPGCTLAEALAPLAERRPDQLAGADLWRSVVARTRRPSPSPADSAAEGQPGSLYAGSWEETCLRIVGHVSEALEHAHARGVMHRDLKPSNVMITPEGRVMLMDFGLSHTEGADTVTRSGDRIGSIPYMPPELLRDGPRALDRRSDVYGLGVTLYELLTLHLPFSGSSVPALLADILDGRPPRPRAYHPGLSWEAETVCLAAIDRDPLRRYASAADLTRDLSNALQHKPVEARRASRWLRARRWLERHPGEAAAALLLLLLPVVAALLLSREARTVHAALGVAQENRARALHSIDVMLVRLSDRALDGVPGMLGVRAEFLAEAARLYEEFLDERPDDLEAVLLAGRCVHLHNRLMRDEARFAEAEGSIRTALARMQPWATDGPLQLRKLRAQLLDDAKFAVRLQERHAEADALATEAIAIQRSVLRDEPESLASRQLLLSMLSDQIEGRNLAGDTLGGLEVLRASVTELRDLAAHPVPGPPGRATDDGLQRGLVDALKNLAHGLALSGRHAEAAEVLAEQLELLGELLGAHPRDEGLRFKLAQTASLLGGELISEGRNEEALDPLELATEQIDRVRRDFPDVAAYEYLAAHIASNYSAALGNLKRFEESGRIAEIGVEILGVLRERYPENAEYTRTLGTLVLGIALRQATGGAASSALETCDAAVALFERALRARPASDEWRKWLAISEYTRAKALLALERPADAARALVQCVKLAGPYADVASSALQRLGQCLDEAGDGDDLLGCQEAVDEALTLAVERGDLEHDEHLRALQAALLAQ